MKIKTKIHYSLIMMLVILFLPFVFGSCNQIHKKTELKLAHSLDPSHPVHKGMVYMSELLKGISGGEMSITIYPSGQLGSEQQCLELLQIGSLAITKVSAAVLEGFTDNFQVLGLPYIFRSKEHANEVFDGPIGEELLLSIERYNMLGLCFYDAGARSFYTIDKPINTPDDLKGLKMRVMPSQTAMGLVKAMGGAPTPISWGELYTALQSGVVDGAENNPPSFYTSHHYEVCKYYSLNEHTIVPDVLVVSTVVWNKLTEQEQEWLTQAARMSVSKQRLLWEESEKESLMKVQEYGVIINYPDKELFAKKVEDMIATYEQKPHLYSLIKRIREVE